MRVCNEMSRFVLSKVGAVLRAPGTIMAAIMLAAVVSMCSAGISPLQAVADDGLYLGDCLGITRADLVGNLRSHENDGFYLGTAYPAYEGVRDNNIWPNGDPRPDGYAAMNCAGFVARAVWDAGGDTSCVYAAEPSSMADAGASAWYEFCIQSGIQFYYFDDGYEMINSGVLTKGDIVVRMPQSWPYLSVDTHLLIYWGDGPTEDCWWQTTNVNEISSLEIPGAPSFWLVMPLSERGSIDVQLTSAWPALTNGNSDFSLEGAIYNVYTDYACTDCVSSITTDAGGYARTDSLLDGRYYVRAATAPAGYLLDETVYIADVEGPDVIRANVGCIALLTGREITGETRLAPAPTPTPTPTSEAVLSPSVETSLEVDPSTSSETENPLTSDPVSDSAPETAPGESASPDPSPSAEDQTDESSTFFTRLSGQDRYGTNSAVVQSGWQCAGTAILATGSNYPDALAAAALAGLDSAPIILTEGSSLSADAAQTITALGVTRVIVPGGTEAVSENVMAQLYGMGLCAQRFAGQTRTTTALHLYSSRAGRWGTTAIVAAGSSYPDALSVSPWSYATSSPIFLTEADGRLSETALAAIRSGGFTRIVIVGGANAVSADTESRLNGFDVVRLAGETRYETSAVFAEFALAAGLSADNVGLATGGAFPDALSGGALCGARGSVLLLMSGSNADTVRFFLDRCSANSAIVFGGTAAVPDEWVAAASFGS